MNYKINIKNCQILVLDDEITRNLELLGAEAGSDEKLYYQMESAFDNDMRTEKVIRFFLIFGHKNIQTKFDSFFITN